MTCRHYYISGKVQGVFYRASTEEVALSLGLAGWVRNMPDGRVEVVACGNEAQLAKLESWFYQGPPMSRVDNVDIQVTTEVHSNNFKIRY